MSSRKAVCGDCASTQGSKKGKGVLSKAKTAFKGWINNNRSKGYKKVPLTECPNCKPADAKKFSSDSLYIHTAQDYIYHTDDNTHPEYHDVNHLSYHVRNNTFVTEEMKIAASRIAENVAICRDEIYRYIWGDEAFQNRESRDEENVIVERVYSMLNLENSPVLDYFIAMFYHRGKTPTESVMKGQP
ncbi:hypothetical protein F4678DRAFT_481800 [Xylaria arbuscula]|nr:hypothetical protein F4678DRAFT_481800 [Xylaria arbuscula]